MGLGRDSYADRRSGVAADRVEVVMAAISDKPLTAPELAASGASLSEIALPNSLERKPLSRRGQSPGALPKSSVNKIIWAQAGRVTEPGRYMFKFGWLTVTPEDLAVWKQTIDLSQRLHLRQGGKKPAGVTGALLFTQQKAATARAGLER
jgi:hypothetical protein